MPQSSCRSFGIARRAVGFTLVELLVVIGIIALLISILLPSLNKARESVRGIKCKSMLRQWAMATLMYRSENRDMMPDGYKYLDYSAGLPKYMSKGFADESVTRCPSDNEARLGTIGLYTPATPTTPAYDYQLRDRKGDVYNPVVSIGINVNAFSNGTVVSGGKLVGRRVKPNTFKMLPSVTTLNSVLNSVDITKIMIFGDFQNPPENPDRPENGGKQIAVPTVQPMFSSLGTTSMGTIAFRHQGRCNAAYLDGHVGALTAKITLKNNGQDMMPGSDWRPTDAAWPTGLSKDKYSPFASHQRLFSPFGPGNERNGWFVYGDFPTVQID
ncbi:MAG: prepilin-type N-terminal cleavage/methylation domain-containing protein [Tepidisphaeraceae bacterium]